MSTCISRAGEYGAHEPGDWCPRCGAFNEESIVAERDRLRAALRAVRSVCMNTDGDYLDGEAEIPVGEVLRMLAETVELNELEVSE